ncbi:hypothetical protein HNQ94_000053 [Salirhabdus euzebyi]|uniref:DUF7669 domain-containing protein n=1 Tax=Salirhabdus euzebyi TaxID=394506 RepID=A0A841Q164_9BACI|nr:hypothetical protein [Salirhabdus euzebyi]MBB6451632.1 hypothetical protein [Salirhabdus euzebyi]
MVKRTCREEILQVVHSIVKERNKNEFTISEVIKLMKQRDTIYAEGTIRTHINSRCCSNASNHHGTVYNDFERIEYGKYKLADITQKDTI